MDCPYCDHELFYDDYYGLGIPGTPEFRKIGDIYSCHNEGCWKAHEGYGKSASFYTDQNGDLHDGYPC